MWPHWKFADVVSSPMELRVEKWESEVREPIMGFLFKPTSISVPLKPIQSTDINKPPLYCCTSLHFLGI